MLNLTDTLFIGTLFRVLVLSIAGGDGLAIGGGMGIKDSNIKKGTLVALSALGLLSSRTKKQMARLLVGM